MQRYIRLMTILGGIAAVTLTGCAGVEPWDRDVLARPDMQIVSDPLEAAVDDHIYLSQTNGRCPCAECLFSLRNRDWLRWRCAKIEYR
jgi:hypothetical protein